MDVPRVRGSVPLPARDPPPGREVEGAAVQAQVGREGGAQVKCDQQESEPGQPSYHSILQSWGPLSSPVMDGIVEMWYSIAVKCLKCPIIDILTA